MGIKLIGLREFAMDKSSELAERIYINAKSRTPVDTGYAKSRWYIKSEGDDIVVGNDAHYALQLELGSSKQAPAGMLRVATLEEISR